MPFTMPNFQPISFQEANPFLTGMASGQQLMQNFLKFPQDMQAKILENQLNAVKARYAEPSAQADLEKQQLANQYYGRNMESQIGLRGAQQGYYGTQSDMNRMKIKNPGLMGGTEAQNIALEQMYKNNPEAANIFHNLVNTNLQKQQAMARYYSQGGPGMGVGAKEESFFQQNVANDNPQLKGDPQKIYEASNVLRSGGNILSDGTKLNRMSPATQASADRLTKYGTTSPIITQGITANQAEAELPILDKYINEGVQPYGTTVWGISDQQIKDMASPKDHIAQERLGKYMGSQVLLFDRASLTLKINALPAGVTIADEVKKLSNQTINAKFPLQTAEARKISSDYVSKALMEGLKARRSVPIGASSLNSGGKKESSTKVQVWGRDASGKAVRIS